MSTRGSGIALGSQGSSRENAAPNADVGTPPPSAPSTLPQPSSPVRRPGIMNAFTRNFFSTNRTDRSERGTVDYVTNEGSIKKEAWTLMSKGNANKTRVRTLRNIQDSGLSESLLVASLSSMATVQPPPATRSVKRTFNRLFDGFKGVMRRRSLQVSTLEGVWHETNDMLAEPETRDPTLQVLIELTETQKFLGLALRHTFFEKIRELGCEEKTLRWLGALSEDGKNLNGFEKAMDFVMADWVEKTLATKSKDGEEGDGQRLQEQLHALADKVILMTQQLFIHNSAFISEASRVKMVHAVCLSCAGGCHSKELGLKCLELLLYVLKYSDLPRSQLEFVITTLCSLLLVDEYKKESWNVTRSLLTSQLGHRTRKILLSMLEQSSELLSSCNPQVLKTLRGAVFCLAQATWGTDKVESVRCSPASVIASMEGAATASSILAVDVLCYLRRLFNKFGRDLQHICWKRIIRLFSRIYTLIQQGGEYADGKCSSLLASLMDVMEQLHRDKLFNGSSDDLYELVESCESLRSDLSIMALIEYRTKAINQLTTNWISEMKNLVMKYTHPSQSTERRKRALSNMHSMYMQYRLIEEDQLVHELMVPVLSSLIPREEACDVQFLMISILFNVAETVSMRGAEGNSLFDAVLGAIRVLFLYRVAFVESQGSTGKNSGEDQVSCSSSLKKDRSAVCLENLEIMAQNLDKLLDDRWRSLQLNHLREILDMLMEHIRMQISMNLTSGIGADIRVRAVSAILSITCCPTTGKLIRYSEKEKSMIVNWLITVGNDNGSFSWNDVCLVITELLVTETWYPVVKTAMNGLRRVLECTRLVHSVGAEARLSLLQAIITAYDRQCERLPRDENANVKEFTRCFAGPLLASALYFSQELDSQLSLELCRRIVHSIRVQGNEFLLGVSQAIQLCPEGMAAEIPVLLDALSSIPPYPDRAIPVLEFLTDALLEPYFLRRFQVEEFKKVVEIISPFANLTQVNPFIVVTVHRLLMAWFVQMNERIRPEMSKFILESVRRASQQSLPHRGDNSGGQQVENTLYPLLGFQPDTPPPPFAASSSILHTDQGDKVSEELYTSLSLFLYLGRIDDENGVYRAVEDERISITSSQHFWFNHHILSVKTLVPKDEEEVSEMGGESNFGGSGRAVASPARNGMEERRRYQSAVQSSERLVDRNLPRRTRDDFDTPAPSLRSAVSATGRLSFSGTPRVTFTQLVVRSMYGRRCWLMRSLEALPEDFLRARSLPDDAASMLQHVSGLPGSIAVGKVIDSEELSTRLRNLDRIPGLELHAVGILYKDFGQTTQAEFLANIYGSDRYARFIKLLGSPSSLASCPGGLIDGKHGTYTYVHKDELNKIVFLVATLMPVVESDPHCNEKKKLINNNFISVIFNESGVPHKLENGFAQVLIEIVPADGSSLLLTVHSREEVKGLLGVRKILLPDRAAAAQLRALIVRTQLAVNVTRSLQSSPDQPYLGLAIDRLRRIRILAERSSSQNLSSSQSLPIS